jgi:hypothetical protein
MKFNPYLRSEKAASKRPKHSKAVVTGSSKVAQSALLLPPKIGP